MNSIINVKIARPKKQKRDDEENDGGHEKERKHNRTPAAGKALGHRVDGVKRFLG
jgi:hypothetical protein